MLIAIIGDLVLGKLASLTAQVEPEKMKYDDDIQLLEDHYAPKPNLIGEELRFSKLIQESGEPLSAFLTRSKVPAQTCRFGDRESTIAYVIVACAVLHNLCIQYNQPSIQLDDKELLNEDDYGTVNGTDLATELGFQPYEPLIVCRKCNMELQTTIEIVIKKNCSWNAQLTPFATLFLYSEPLTYPHGKKPLPLKGNTDIRPRERAIWRSLLKTLSRYGLEKTAEKSARITVFGRVLPRYLRLASGRGFSWEELEEVDLRYRARASSMKYDRGHRVRGYDRATTIARLRMKIVELQTQLTELVALND
ncbi:hypothetical protein ACHWQZ_G019497 [Mnemiopsis leidyi]